MSSVFLFQSMNSQDEVVSFPDFFTLRMGISNSYNSYEVYNEANNERILISPNQEITSTFTFLFRSLEIDIGFTPHFLNFNSDNDKKGDSKLFVLNLRSYLGRWMQSIDLYSTKGFYVSKASFDLPEDDYITLPDLKSFKIGGTTSYILNDKFSFRAISFQNEWQRKSAGSFIPRLAYYFTKIEDRSTGDRSEFFDIAVGPSYHYNFVIHENIIFSVGGFAGIGANFSKTRFNENSSVNHFNSIAYDLAGRASLGYNSKRFYTGFTNTYNFFFYHEDRSTAVEAEQVFFEFYLGYRFNAPKKWIRAANKVNQKLGIEEEEE